MRTCKTCKHWEVVPENYFRGWLRECRSGKIHEEDSPTDDTDHLVYPYYEGGAFYPGPDFGCVHHEEVEIAEEDPWELGRIAGAEYFNRGISTGRWEYPDLSPFEKGSPKDEGWWNGFSFGEESAESAWECG